MPYSLNIEDFVNDQDYNIGPYLLGIHTFYITSLACSLFRTHIL